MNEINVLFRNFEDWQFMLIIPALQAMLQQGWRVHILKGDLVTPAWLKKMQPAIQLHASQATLNKNRTEIRPFVFGRKSSEKSKTLYLPIIRQQEVEAYRAQKDRLRLPLSKQSQLGYRTVDVPSLIDFVYYLNRPHPLKGKRVLITGGPTAEDIDPVRFITNRSSGKMGLALARAAFMAGAEVRFILGPSPVSVPEYLNCLKVRSAAEMAETVFRFFDEVDFYIGAAAVADFKPLRMSEHKIKKSSAQQDFLLHLGRTIDILSELNRRRKKQKLIGFSVETENEIEHSRQKLLRKGLDCIIINNPQHKGAAFGQETNKVTVLTKDGKLFDWPLMNKLDLSLKIMDLLSELE